MNTHAPLPHAPILIALIASLLLLVLFSGCVSVSSDCKVTGFCDENLCPENCASTGNTPAVTATSALNSQTAAATQTVPQKNVQGVQSLNLPAQTQGFCTGNPVNANCSQFDANSCSLFGGYGGQCTLSLASPFGASGGVAVMHAGACGETDYPAASDSDAARGTALVSAAQNAANGDVLYLSPGNFDVGSATIDLTVFRTGGASMHGSGMNATTIISEVSSGTNQPVISAGLNSKLTDFSYLSHYTDYDKVPLSIGGGSDYNFGTVYLKNIAITSPLSAITAGGTNVHGNVVAQNITITGNSSAVRLMLSPGDTFTMYDSNIILNAIARVPAIIAVSASSGTINFFNTAIKALGDNNTTTRVWAIVTGHQKTPVWMYGRVNIYGGSVRTAGAPSMLDLYNADANAFIGIDPSVDYNHSKTSGVITSIATVSKVVPPLPAETCANPLTSGGTGTCTGTLSCGAQNTSASCAAISGCNWSTPKTQTPKIGCNALSNGLAAYYSFNDFNDASGNTNNALVHGNVKIQTLFGGNNDATFGGVSLGDYLSLANSPSLALSGAMSVSFWLNPWMATQGNALEQYGLFTLSSSSYNLAGFGNSWALTPLAVDADGHTYYYLGGGKPAGGASGDIPADGNWHYYVHTRDANGNYAVYVDGILKASGGCTSYVSGSPLHGPCTAPPHYATTTGPFTIGLGSGSATNYRGGLDELRIYNRKLSDTEVAKIYSLGIAGGKPSINPDDVNPGDCYLAVTLKENEQTFEPHQAVTLNSDATVGLVLAPSAAGGTLLPQDAVGTITTQSPATSNGHTWWQATFAHRSGGAIGTYWAQTEELSDLDTTISAQYAKFLANDTVLTTNDCPLFSDANLNNPIYPGELSASLVRVGGTLDFVGAPFVQYSIQSATDWRGPWKTFGSVTASGDGTFSYPPSFSVTGVGVYFRAVPAAIPTGTKGVVLARLGGGMDTYWQVRFSNANGVNLSTGYIDESCIARVKPVGFTVVDAKPVYGNYASAQIDSPDTASTSDSLNIIGGGGEVSYPYDSTRYTYTDTYDPDQGQIIAGGVHDTQTTTTTTVIPNPVSADGTSNIVGLSMNSASGPGAMTVLTGQYNCKRDCGIAGEKITGSQICCEGFVAVPEGCDLVCEPNNYTS